MEIRVIGSEVADGVTTSTVVVPGLSSESAFGFEVGGEGSGGKKPLPVLLEWTGCLSAGSDTLSACCVPTPRASPGFAGWGFQWLLFQEQPERNVYAALQGHRALGRWYSGVGGGQLTCP